ncbi:MAG: Sec-independent protein translocase subunit TatA [Kineosporiaceae bacterium]
MFRNGLEPAHLLLLLVVVLVLFGGKRLPDAARGLGRSMRIFKSEISAMQEDKSSSTPAPKPTPPEALEGRVVDDEQTPRTSSTEPRRDA